MAINIKEIFTGDSENQKIDKLNYNFDQILANGGGPIGATGAAGDTGATGADGAQGPIGPDGPQGIAGDYTDFFVVEDPAATNYQSIYTKSVLGAVTSLTVGEVNADANGNVGVYGASAIRAIGSSFGNNVLRLDVDGVSGNYIDLNITDDTVDRILKFNPSATGTSDTSYEFVGSTLKLISGGSTKVTLGETESTFESDVRFNADVKLPTGASTGKVLKSADANGTFSWGDPGVVPIGTIVMVPGFVLQNSIDWNGTAPAVGSTDYVGRGIDGSSADAGDWSGWYYCSGQTWTGSGKSYIVPDMRDRMPLGYQRGSTGDAGSDTNGTSGSATATINVAAHTHSINTTDGSAGDNGGPSFDYINTVNPSTGPSGAINETIDLRPKATTLGYMIYLENDSLVYATGGGGGPLGA